MRYERVVPTASEYYSLHRVDAGKMKKYRIESIDLTHADFVVVKKRPKLTNQEKQEHPFLQFVSRTTMLPESVRSNLGDLYAESGQTLPGSFSAVSKLKFASKYSLELAICSKRILRKGTWRVTEK